MPMFARVSRPQFQLSIPPIVRRMFGPSPASFQIGKFAEQKWWDGSTVALVTGANKGIGLEIARFFAKEGLTVVMGARNTSLGAAAVNDVRSSAPGAQVSTVQLDITKPESVAACVDNIKAEFGKVDILVNNAGIAYKGSTFGATEAAVTIDCNFKGTRQVCEAIIPIMPEGSRIVSVCSRAGLLRQIKSEELRRAFEDPKDADEIAQLTDAFVEAVRDDTWRQKGWSSSMYGVSKVAEASYSRWLSQHVKSKGIVVYACCPGYVVTDMTSGRGYKSAPEGADTPVWLSLQPFGSIPSGGFYGERQQVPGEWMPPNTD